jgi:hypothetical protein
MSALGGKRTLGFWRFKHAFMDIEGLSVFKLDKMHSPGRKPVEVRSGPFTLSRDLADRCPLSRTHFRRSTLG